ncbi:MAG TPA: fibronectin type III domain-containing protein [Abditibacteriaceae bacterium]
MKHLRYLLLVALLVALPVALVWHVARPKTAPVEVKAPSPRVAKVKRIQIGPLPKGEKFMSNFFNNNAGEIGARGTYAVEGVPGSGPEGSSVYSNGSHRVTYFGGDFSLAPIGEGEPSILYTASANGDPLTFPLTGWSTNSGIAPAPTFTLAPAESPTAPLAPIFDNVTTAAADFTVPAALSEGALTYKLQYRLWSLMDENAWTIATTGLASDDEYSLTGLAINKRYEVRYVAVNSAGETGGEIAALFTDVPVPDEPVFVSANDNSISVTYGDGGSDNVQWVLRYRKVGAINWLTATFTQLANVAYTITGLTSGSVYEVYVIAAGIPGGNREHDSGIVLMSTSGTAPAVAVPPPPVVTIVSGTAANVAGIVFDGDWGPVNLEYQRVGYASFVVPVTESTVKSLTGLIEDVPYRARFIAIQDADSATSSWTPFTPSEDDGGDGDGDGDNELGPQAPGEVRLVRLTAISARAEMPALPAGADFLRLIFSSGTLIADSLVGGAVVNITGLTAETDYTVRARAVNVFGMKNGPDLLFTTESEDEQQPPDETPGTPDAPTATRDCADGVINVTAPAWDEDPEVTSMELRRRVNAGGGFGVWSTIHTWVADGGTYEDSDVAAFSIYEYAVRALNGAGESAWSTVASLTLQSSNLTLTWQLPLADAEIAARQTLRVQLVDSNETFDVCGGVNGGGACALQSANITLYLDGIQVALTWTKISGSTRNGFYEAVLDTRDYAQGERTLQIRAKGSDCCLAKADRDVVFDNTLRSGTLYFEHRWEGAPPAGQEYGKAQILMQNEALYDHPTRRYWVKMGLTTQEADLVDWASVGLTPSAKGEAFDELQPFLATGLQKGTTPTREQVGGYVPLLTPGPELFLVQQWNPVEALSTFLTGITVGAVRSIRRFSNGLYHVFASKDDGTTAKLFSFDCEEGLTELLDLSEHNAADALDCIRVNDKYFVVTPAEVFTVDVDAGEIEMPTDPRGETRLGRFVLKVPGATAGNDIALGLYVDDELEEEQSAAYDLTYKSPKLLWKLDEVVGLAEYGAGQLLLAAGAKLYITDDITGAPTLDHTFGANITSLGLSDENWLAGLADNHVWALVGGAWVDRGALTTPPLALSGWEGSGETFYEVAGGDSAQLFERILSGGLWSDLRQIVAADEEDVEVTQITALARYSKVTREAQGTPGEPGYQPEVSVIGVLIGTAPDGALLLLELSPITAANALLASKMSHYALEGFETPIR